MLLLTLYKTKQQYLINKLINITKIKKKIFIKNL